tara:strand:- start:739 stop:1065 length:327 start_codon:yes stop_codon:yes gene_type:complete
MEVLDLRSKQSLTIKADFGKNFSVVFSGFENLDTDYTLDLTKGKAADTNVSFTVGSGITLDDISDPKTLTLDFTGSAFSSIGKYKGTLASSNKNANVFLEIDITLELS